MDTHNGFHVDDIEMQHRYQVYAISGWKMYLRFFLLLFADNTIILILLEMSVLVECIE